MIHAFRMQLRPGMTAQYRAAHDAIWPELVDLLHDAGISDYSIWHDADSNALFATLVLADENQRDALPSHPVMQRWWAAMAPLMETNADGSPREWPLKRVFHLA